MPKSTLIAAAILAIHSMCYIASDGRSLPDDRISYDGYSVVSIRPSQSRHINLIRQLENDGKISLLSPRVLQNSLTSLLVSPDQKQLVDVELSNADINTVHRIEDLGE